MQKREIEIVNKLGLHARASAKLTQLAAKFDSDVQVTRHGRKVNAKSIMGVMMLAAGKGSRVVVEADGEDAEQAMGAILALKHRQDRARCAGRRRGRRTRPW